MMRLRPIYLLGLLAGLVAASLSAGCASAPSARFDWPKSCPASLQRSGAGEPSQPSTTVLVPLFRNVTDMDPLMHKRVVDGCADDDAVSCVLAGAWYFGFYGPVRMRPMRARPFFQHACKLKLGAGCSMLGRLAEVEHTDDDAFALYRKACKLGDSFGCSAVARFWLAKGAHHDVAKGSAVAARSCQLGHGFACRRLAERLSDRSKPAADPSCNIALWQEACRQGEQLSCERLDWKKPCANGAVCDREGKPVVDARAKRALIGTFERQCDDGDELKCVLAGYAHMQRGPFADPKRTRELLEEPCEDRDLTACHWLGVAEYSTDDRATFFRGFRRLRRNCRSGSVHSCYEAAVIWADFPKKYRDADEQLSFLRKACQGNSEIACLRLGYMYQHGEGVAADLRRAFLIFRNTCDKGSRPACERTGVMYEMGLGVHQSAERAAQNYQKACVPGMWETCLKYATALGDGDGIAQDVSRAIELVQPDCNNGSKTACALIDKLQATEHRAQAK